MQVECVPSIKIPIVAYRMRLFVNARLRILVKTW